MSDVHGAHHHASILRSERCAEKPRIIAGLSNVEIMNAMRCITSHRMWIIARRDEHASRDNVRIRSREIT
jgi:hypothetical protein